jgi:catechol 2,3-dioxygenase-like lactoylglutathione lyase family enzyme
VEGKTMDEILTIVETAICVDDLDRACAFYRDVLGLELHGQQPGRHAFFRVGPQSMLLLFLAETTTKDDHLPPHGTTGAGHFAFGIPAGSLSAWRERLTQHNVRIEQEVEWERGGRSLYFRDPAGNLVEILTPGVWGLPSGW